MNNLGLFTLNRIDYSMVASESTSCRDKLCFTAFSIGNLSSSDQEDLNNRNRTTRGKP
ncbi:hypothetical protein IAD21_05176 [Abditibacteriota bacterium]|nr:hypothetical protein IAD21_05176 [Abditibacteriota bacterium]